MVVGARCTAVVLAAVGAERPDVLVLQRALSWSGGSAGIINDASNIEIVGNTFGGNDAGADSGDTRAIQIYEGTRNPEPTHDVFIHDNVLNGDLIRSCTITGVTCD